MIEQVLQSDIIELIKKFGDLGVFLAMFLESSIVPIPSEAIVVAAGAIGVPVVSIVIFGSLGSTIGGMVGYAIGRYAAMPVIVRFGKYIFIKPHHIEKAQAFARKYGVLGVLIGRIIPIIPFKVFSIASGTVSTPFIPFVVCTLIGVVPRMYLLALFGASILRYKKISLYLLLFAVLAFIVYKILQNRSLKRNTQNVL
ncbi:MAG: DedA family protein [Candidatus Omnitrophica bacterium]|nr:DedA family protein [Candidatus Omnitrophota bacterium]